MAKNTLELVTTGTLQLEIDARKSAVASIITKIDKSLVSDVGFGSNANGLNATINTIDPATDKTNTYQKPLPIASADVAGVMSKESFIQIQQNTSNIATLMNQQGGKYIGASFNTKADLDKYVVPSTVNVNDFTYVANDETHSNETSMYMYNGTAFVFARPVDQTPVPPATGTTLGLVMSSAEDGKILVQTDGTMMLNGYDELVANDNNLATAISTKLTANIPVVGNTGIKVTYDSKGLVTGSANLVEADIPELSQSKITGLSTALSAKADESTVDSLTTVTNTKLTDIQTQVNGKALLTDFNTLNTKVTTEFALRNHYVKELIEQSAGSVNYTYTGAGYIESIVAEINGGAGGTNSNVDVTITVDGDSLNVYNHTFNIPAGISRYALANNHGSFQTGISGLFILKDMAPLVVDSTVIEFTYPTIQLDFASSIIVSIKPSAGSTALITAAGIRITKITRK